MTTFFTVYFIIGFLVCALCAVRAAEKEKDMSPLGYFIIFLFWPILVLLAALTIWGLGRLK